VNREACALGEVLAQQAIGVFVRAALPGLALFAEEHGASQVCADVSVTGHLDALVPGDRAPQVRRQGAQVGHQTTVDEVGMAGSGHRHQNGEAGGALNEGGDVGTVAGAGDEVAVPMPGLETLQHVGWAVADHPQRQP